MSDFFSYQGTPPTQAAPAPGAEPLSILSDLSSEDWEQFISYTARRRYPAGAVLVHAGETDRALCFIASGGVELSGPGLPDGTRGEGEVFGLLSFLDGAASAVTASVSAAGPAELLRLTPDALQQLSAWQPRIALALMRDLGALVAARLRRLQPAD
jgi:CRP-like cAMP-binding protein